jgi:hypothetical protein
MNTFEQSVVTHKMIVHRNEGLYRHLEFRREDGSGSDWFEVVTWPFGMVVRGWPGTYVFSRVEDMFAFFRDREDDQVLSDIGMRNHNPDLFRAISWAIKRYDADR